MRNAKKSLVSRQVITDNYVKDDLPGGVWKISKTRDVSKEQSYVNYVFTIYSEYLQKKTTFPENFR